MKLAFFGTPTIATIALNELKQSGIIPDLIITNPDAKVGRKQVLTPPPVATWAKENSIPILQPTSLKDKADFPEFLSGEWDLFIVVAYGKLIPKWLLDIPQQGTLNLHPSLLPKFRGASPIRSAILADERETGVTIMLLDEELDHGPILAQKKADIAVANWPTAGQDLDDTLAHLGGALLADTIPKFLAGEITPIEQKHDEATFCTKIDKSMSEVQVDPKNLPGGKTAYEALLKIRAFDGWPETFFIYDGKRIKIKSAELDEVGNLKILRIIPEGKSETDFDKYFAK